MKALPRCLPVARPLHLIFVALDLALLPEIFSRQVEQATDGPRKGLNPPPSLR